MSASFPMVPGPNEVDQVPNLGPSGDAFHPLSPDEVKTIIHREMQDALGGVGSQVSEQQRLGIRYFYGRPLGNEIKDRSQVVSRDALMAVEWTMPSLMRMFTGGTTIGRYKPNNEAGVENADIATGVINYDFLNKLDGFSIIHDWFKTGLMEKNGVVHAYWEVSRFPTVVSYEGITEEELFVLMDDDDIEPLALEEQEKQVEGLGLLKTFDITVRKWEVVSQLRCDPIPPEEFLIARRAIKLNDKTPFCAHRKKMLASDLVAMGFDFEMVANLPHDDTPEYTMGRTERLSEDETFPVTTAERSDAAAREIWVADCQMRIDEDGDGYAELRRMLVVGDGPVHVLEDEEISHGEYVSITPVPVPHKFFGLSLIDLVLDIQTINSTLMRQILDHVYLTNNPRLAIVEGQVEIDDLLTVQPGGLVRQRQPGQIEPIELPRLPAEAFQMLAYMKEEAANRTGIMAHGQELDASAINSTATGMAALMAEKAQKIELIARIYGNGLKKLFRLFLRLYVENDSKERQFLHHGKWITINPANWDKEMDLDIEIGLGAGQAIERIANIEKLMSVQREMVAKGLLGITVTLEDIHRTAVAMSEACGFGNDEFAFTSPEGKEMPPPPPDPALKKVELDALKAKSEVEHKTAVLQLEKFTEENLVAHRAMELESQERVKMADIQARERAALGQQEATIEAAQISADARKQSPAPESEAA